MFYVQFDIVEDQRLNVYLERFFTSPVKLFL